MNGDIVISAVVNIPFLSVFIFDVTSLTNDRNIKLELGQPCFIRAKLNQLNVEILTKNNKT